MIPEWPQKYKKMTPELPQKCQEMIPEWPPKWPKHGPGVTQKSKKKVMGKLQETYGKKRPKNTQQIPEKLPIHIRNDVFF